MITILDKINMIKNKIDAIAITSVLILFYVGLGANLCSFNILFLPSL